MLELLSENRKVVGAMVEKEGVKQKVFANNGVLLCAGGFAHNVQMREKHSSGPVGDKWASVPVGDNCDAVIAGNNIGAALALMDEAWWEPTFVNPTTGERHFSVTERSLPHRIIVDPQGERYMNEVQSYVDCGYAIYERNKKVPAIPSWMVFDSRHRNRYLLTSFPPGQTPKDALEFGFIIKADKLDQLTEKLGTGELSKTVLRFNDMSKNGIDEYFGGGRTVYDQYFDDPTCKPNPKLGSIQEGPFFAMKVWPGDLGTKGGLVTDECARVLRNDGGVTEGLYAAGNTTASVMGRTYPGPGVRLGPALTFAFIAADHMSGKKIDSKRRNC